MTTGTSPLVNPAALFTFDWVFLSNGKLSFDIWVKRPAGDTRGVIDAAIEITFDSNDVSLASGVSGYALPAGWTGIVGGSSKIILAMFNSTESTASSGQQIYVDPVFETAGKHAGEQKLASLVLDVKPLVTEISPVKVVVETFTDSLGFTYPGSGGVTGPLVLPEFEIAVSGVQVVTGGSDADSLDAAVAARALVFGEAGNDTGINLSPGDAFVGGPGIDLARITGEQSTYTVKLASSGLEAALRDAISSANGPALESGVPLFAISPVASPGQPVLVQAESLQFATATAAVVSPLRLLNTGTATRFVDASDPNAFASIGQALSSAAVGDTIVVSTSHQEPNAVSFEVRVNDIRVMLLNPEAEPLTFRLAESAAVTRFTLLGIGAANVLGNSHANLLIGNDAFNLIDGGGGDDTIMAGGGEDEVHGGAGADWLDGGDGWDTVSGGSGGDVLLSAGGGQSAGNASQPASWETDVLVGGSGADVLMASGAEQSGGVRMLGGSGADLYRLMAVAGADGNPEPGALSYRVHVADLTINDGLDLSAFAGGSTLQPDFGGSFLSGRISPIAGSQSTPSGDVRISLANLVVQGLASSGEGSDAVPSPAPFAPVTSVSELIVSMVSQESDILAALDRGDSLQSDASAAASRSVQELAESVLPIYFSHEQLLNQLVQDLAP